MSDTIIAVIVGGAIATIAPIVVEWLRGNRESDMDRKKRADDRAIERDRIQLAKLEALQAALEAMAHVTAQIHGARIDASKRAGRWVQIRDVMFTTPDLAEANRGASLEVETLAAVVLDDEVRDLCDRARLEALKVGVEGTEEASQRAFLEHVRLVSQASTRAGAVIRSILLASTER